MEAQAKRSADSATGGLPRRRNRALTIAMLTFVILAAWAWLIYGLLIDGVPASNPRAWYTVDDGRTFFVGPGGLYSPIDHEGQKAYRVYVFTVDGGATTFVSCLERYPDQVRKRLEELEEKSKTTTLSPEATAFVGSAEVKAPLTGDSGWIPQTDPRAMKLLQPLKPDGRPADPVYPPAG